MAGKTVPRSYRISREQSEFIQELVALQILGTNGSAVLRTLLNNAIKELVESEFVRKYKEGRGLLKKE